MKRRFRNSRGSTTLLALAIALGLILGAWILGSQIKAIRLADRYVTVKGLVERKGKSDFAIWPLGFKEAGDDFTALSAKTETDKNIVLQFLAQQGMQSSEIEIGVIRVMDTQANEYGARPASVSSTSRSPCVLLVSIRLPPRRRKPCCSGKKESRSVAIPARAPAINSTA